MGQWYRCFFENVSDISASIYNHQCITDLSFMAKALDRNGYFSSFKKSSAVLRKTENGTYPR